MLYLIYIFSVPRTNNLRCTDIFMYSRYLCIDKYLIFIINFFFLYEKLLYEKKKKMECLFEKYIGNSLKHDWGWWN